MLNDLVNGERMIPVGGAPVHATVMLPLITERIARLAAVRNMETGAVRAMRARMWHALTLDERAHYAAPSLSGMTAESVRRLALVEDLDIALGTHPGIRRA
jgi:hypothetical protein